MRKKISLNQILDTIWKIIFWWVKKDFYLFVIFSCLIMGGGMYFYFTVTQEIANQNVSLSPTLQINPREYRAFINYFQERENRFLKAYNEAINEIFFQEAPLDFKENE